MKHLFPIALIAVLLGSLAISAPKLNQNQPAPRSVFVVLPDTVATPTVQATVSQTRTGGWRLRIETAHFQFTDLCVPTAQPIPVGHAHVIVNGRKVGSAYLPVFDLGDLPPGTHRISVVLRGQDHRALVGRNGLIQDRIQVQIDRQAAPRV